MRGGGDHASELTSRLRAYLATLAAAVPTDASSLDRLLEQLRQRVEGHDLPYLMLAAGIFILDRPDVRLGLATEYQWLRVTSDQFRRTYQDFDLVAEEPLGRVHQWSHAFILGITLDIPL
jgi:hypothetical protein